VRPAPRSRAQRKADTIALLRTEVDCWVASANEPRIVRADNPESPPGPTKGSSRRAYDRRCERRLEITRIERSIAIDRPVAEVWEFVHDTTNDALWQTTLAESTKLTDGPLEVGTRVREVRRFLGFRVETVWEVTEFEANRKSAIRNVSGPIPFSGAYRLEEVDAGTSFTVTGELDAHGFFRLAEPVFARIAGRELEANLGHLKDLLEASSEGEAV
jgi:polyketide cyclase/dehydrase/lipid transport protein